MTRGEILCICGEPLREKANFCVRCGCEMRQQCPICFSDPRRLIAVRDPRAYPWCDTRGELLFACASCGRWFSASVGTCPDPGCKQPVAATGPVATLSAPDGTSYAGAWRWPDVWDQRNQLHYRAPRQDAWRSDTPVYAAFVAHGRLYAWTENRLLMPEGQAGGPLAEMSAQASRVSWRCFLGIAGHPHPRVSIGNLVAVVGDSAILATGSGFVRAGLYPGRADNAVPLNIGVPLAQIAGDGWWVGWSDSDGQPGLWRAPVPANGRNLAWQQVKAAPAGASPRPNAPLTLRNGLACWIGTDDALWQLDCAGGSLQRITSAIEGIQRLWRGRDGPHLVRATSMGLRVGLDAQTPNAPLEEAGGGEGPLKEICASPTLIAVVSEKTITALPLRNGAEVPTVNRYTGAWIAGALADSSAEPRLLLLTQEGNVGDLSALSLATGRTDSIWSEADATPLGLLIAGESLYVVHNRGVTRLRVDS